jgi:DNA-3-methyladenine glycosylase
VDDGTEKIPSRSFYQRHPSVVARQLLGKVLVRRLDGRILSGRIVEAEAYSSDDPASHAFRGRTESNRALYGEPGRAYVYFTYGMHFCLNVVAHRGQPAGGVLIRALEPLEGIDQMMKRRRTDVARNLARGPGNVTRALGIDMRFYGADLTRRGALFILDAGSIRGPALRTSRIGVRAGKEKLWRFVIKDSPYASGPRRVPPAGRAANASRRPPAP